MNNRSNIKQENRKKAILNIFFQYYKQLFGKSNNEKIFDGIDTDNDTSTNRWMELYWEHFEKYNHLITTDIVFIDDPENIDIEKHKEIYQLIVNNVQVKVGNSLLPLIEYIYDNCRDWKNTSWAIETIKSDN